MESIRSVFTCCLMAVAFIGICTAQTGTGSVQGTVRDATNAIVPNARLELTHAQTARSYEITSNEVGYYLFPSVQPGNYTLSASAGGMETWKGQFLLQTGQAATIDPVLKVGGTATEITVAGDVSPLITTVSATLGNVVENARIEQLPLNGRFFQNLVALTTPGVEGSGKPRVYGLRTGSMEFLQDGSLIVNRDTGDVQRRPPGIDSIAEFRVETNNSSAKLSRPASTIVSTKSGTNEIHGAVFHTARNNAFGVARRREDFYEKPPQLIRNEFGASVGGPVFLPKLYNGKNRTFFFVAWEAYRLASASTTSTTMATMDMRQGDFSGLVDSRGRRYTIYDPWTTDAKWQRVPFPNNRIPAQRQSPLSKYVNNVTPAPTHPDFNPMVASNYFGPSPSTRRDYTVTVRVDHKISDKNQMFARYTQGENQALNRRSFQTNGAPITLDGLAQQELAITPNRNGMLSWTRIFSPSFFGETVFTGSDEDFQFNLPSFGNTGDIASELGLPNPFQAPGLPDINDTGFNMVYRGARYRNPMTRMFTLDQNFTKMQGRHEFQFGGRWRYEDLNVLADQETNQGSHSFASLATALYDPNTGSSYGAVPLTGHNQANLFLGVASSYAAKFSRGWFRLRAPEYSLYLQDNFKVNSRLTLNAGLRWEIRPTIHEANDMFTGFDPGTKTIVNGTTLENTTVRLSL